MNSPKVSILLPVYGAERFIERCAVSLFEQTYDNLEYVFVNDCTKDRSIEVLQEVMERYPARKPQVRIINHEVNKGVGAARNPLLDAATGDFILFVDPDDYVDLNLVEKLVAVQQEKDADVVAYDYKTICENNIELRATKDYSSVEDYLKDMLRRETAVGVWGKLLRTSLINKNHIRVEGGVNTSEDFMIVVRAVYYAKRIAICHGAYYFYDRRNEASITSSFSTKKVMDDFKAYDIVGNFFKNSQEYYDAFKVGELKMYIQHIVASALNKHEACFLEAKHRISAMDKSMQNKMRMADKTILYMNLSLAHYYVRIGLQINSIVRGLMKK